MVNRERDNAVALPNERFPRRHLHIIDRKVLLVASERHGLPQKSLRLWRAKQSHRVGAPLERHGTHESGNTEYVVRMHVRKEDLADVERNAVAHHLALSPLATIEEKGLSPRRTASEVTLRSTVGREADVPRKRTLRSMGPIYRS